MNKDELWNFLMSRTTLNDMMDSVLFRMMTAFAAFISLTIIAVLWNGYALWGLTSASASLFNFLFAIVVVFCFIILPAFWQIFLIIYGLDLLAGGFIPPGWLILLPSGCEAALLFKQLAKWLNKRGWKK